MRGCREKVSEAVAAAADIGTKRLINLAPDAWARWVMQRSDVDLLVIMPYTGLAPYKTLEIVTRTDPRFPVDILVRTPDQVAERVALNDFFMREIMERGRVLYAAPDA